MSDNASAGFRTVQDMVRALAPCYGTGFFTKREERVLALRIAHGCTLLETAKTVSRMEGFWDRTITRERVRQIENKALRKWKARHTVHLCPHCGKESVSANVTGLWLSEATHHVPDCAASIPRREYGRPCARLRSVHAEA